MTKDIDLGKIAWDAYVKAVGGKTFDDKPLPDWLHVGDRQKAGWNEAIAAVFDNIHENLHHLDKKYKATANWQALWDEILAFILTHLPKPPSPPPSG